MGRISLILVVMLGLALVGCAVSGPVGVAPSSQEAATATEVVLKVQRITPTERPTEAPTIIPTKTATQTSTEVVTATEKPYSATQTIGPQATATAEFALCSPLVDFPRENLSKTISSAYSPPPPGWDDRHQGVDFVFHRLAGVDHTILGVGIQSVLPGWVAAAVVDSFPYGNVVILETPREFLPSDLRALIDVEDGESLYHLYAHMLEPPLVELRQAVGLCELIGYAGASGRTEAPHLHFETRIGPAGGRFPVMNAFVDGVTEEERRYYKLWRVSMQFAHFDPMLLLGYEIEE